MVEKQCPLSFIYWFIVESVHSTSSIIVDTSGPSVNVSVGGWLTFKLIR